MITQLQKLWLLHTD